MLRLVYYSLSVLPTGLPYLSVAGSVYRGGRRKVTTKVNGALSRPDWFVASLRHGLSKMERISVGEDETQLLHSVDSGCWRRVGTTIESGGACLFPDGCGSGDDAHGTRRRCDAVMHDTHVGT